MWISAAVVTAGPSLAASGVLAAAGLLLAVAGAAADPAGRLLASPAALLLLAVAGRDLLLRPALRADAAGIVVVTGLRRRAVAWTEVERVQVVTDRRAPLLELDLGDTLVLLSRLRLGRPPEAVAAELSALQR